MNTDPTSLLSHLKKVEGAEHLLSQVDAQRRDSCLQGMSESLNNVGRSKGPSR